MKNQTDDFEPVLYLLGRWDIPDMNPGKLGAQCAHAAQEFHAQAMETMEIEPDGDFSKLWSRWCDGRNFGTTIVLKATDAEIHDLMANTGFPHCGYVHDPTYPIRNWQGNVYVTPMDTVAWIFPETAWALDEVRNSGLELYP